MMTVSTPIRLAGRQGQRRFFPSHVMPLYRVGSFPPPIWLVDKPSVSSADFARMQFADIQPQVCCEKGGLSTAPGESRGPNLATTLGCKQVRSFQRARASGPAPHDELSGARRGMLSGAMAALWCSSIGESAPPSRLERVPSCQAIAIEASPSGGQRTVVLQSGPEMLYKLL